jgi:hypothetical protein
VALSSTLTGTTHVDSVYSSALSRLPCTGSADTGKAAWLKRAAHTSDTLCCISVRFCRQWWVRLMRCGGGACHVTGTATHQELEREEARQCVGDRNVAEAHEQARQIQECVGECPRNKITARQGVDSGEGGKQVHRHMRGSVQGSPQQRQCMRLVCESSINSTAQACQLDIAPPTHLMPTTTLLQMSHSWRGFICRLESTPSGSSNHCRWGMTSRGGLVEPAGELSVSGT